LPSAESVIATCLSNRLDYAQVLQDRADRERGVAVASRGSWPDIDLVWRYQERGQDAAASGALTLDENTWFVGISAGSSWPSYGERRALQSAIIERQSADLRVAALAAVISRQAHESLSECRRVRSQLELSEKTYRLARERLVLARKLFEMGRADSFSVAEAEDELQEAEGQWLEAVSGETVAVYRLMHVMGTLLDHPPELKPPAAAR
jgi:outer membrane protein TolC